MTCDEIAQMLRAGSLASGCSPLQNQIGALRIQTLFRYPGGERVDLFWRPSAGAENAGEFTDFGQTMGQLLSMGVDPDVSVRRREFLADICENLKTERRLGEFVVSVDGNGPQSLLDAFVRLGQTCVQAADLFVTRQTRMASPFSDELQEGLEAIGLPVESSVPLIGRGGRRVVVDYVVQGPTRSSGILSLSARNSAKAHDTANDAFTKWFDLTEHQIDYQFVTVLKGEQIANFQPADISRLELLSSVFTYPEEAEALRDLVLS